MSELLLSLLRFGYLALLWLLVVAAIAVLRQDIFGTRVVRRGLPGREDSKRTRIAARLGLVRGGERAAVGAGAAAAGAAGASVRPGVSNRAPTPVGAAGGRVAATRGGPRAGRPQRAPRSAAPTRLVVIDGPLAGTTIPLSSSILVGRAPSSTLVLDDDFASSRHARFFPRGDVWFVEDLGSTNGTTVGGTRVGSTPMEVPVGTPVQIGRTTVEFRR